MKMTPTTLDRKNMKKGLKSPAPASVLALMLALLLVLCSLPVYADEQQTEQPETPTVTQDTGSESVEGVTSSEQDEFAADEIAADELEPMQPIEPQETEAALATDWTEEPPHEGQVLHGGYVGFKNVGSGKYLTVPYGDDSEGANIIQNDAILTPNAQEFLLEYTYNPTYDEAYFRIFSLTVSGTKSYPVKSSKDHPSTSNVILDDINYLYISDRWQLEHVRENYYCIYLASNPDYDDTRYALTAYGNSNGTATGNTTTSPGNVYLSPLNTLNDNQLWQICADGMPMDINGYDITQGGSQEAVLGTKVSYYYVPKAYNMVLFWSVSASGMATSYGGGHFVPQKYGGMTIILQYSAPSDLLPLIKTAVLFSMPATSDYYISNAGTNRYMDIEGPSKQNNTIIQQWDFHTGDYEKWKITNDSSTIGYVRIRSLYSQKYLAVDSNNTSVIKQTLTLDNYSLWKIETTSHGNIKLTCKALESNGVVLTVPLSANSNGTNLTTVSYTNNDNYRDEWSLYQFNATLEVEHYYDQGFTVRYQSF